eukprot:NODE_2627_length_764_cov_74.092308_g1839_i0.p3 GENE.NODE_2627_length_764_cov_74.092308_g1839_i0~~NODE_2627_length_764_cov_74.092308_g1839_i0.p3  ORF type:complete len:65 (-),score=5.95 NODE_2627_length_764_cov_74.092308_g1839_i0:355-549(-)
MKGTCKYISPAARKKRREIKVKKKGGEAKWTPPKKKLRGTESEKRGQKEEGKYKEKKNEEGYQK